VDRRQPVSVAVFDVAGRRVVSLHHAELAAGVHRLPIDASSLSAGLYFVRAAGTGGRASVHRLVVAR
jgi:hypothetical protein